jgi:hypothetical protein
MAAVAYADEIPIELEFECPITLETTELTGGLLMETHRTDRDSACSPKYVFDSISLIQMKPNISCVLCKTQISIENIRKIKPKKTYMEYELKRVSIIKEEQIKREEELKRVRLLELIRVRKSKSALAIQVLPEHTKKKYIHI